MPETNPTTEIWKDIPGYFGNYQASNLGRIRRMPRGNILSFYKTNSGYLRASLYWFGKKFRHGVHQLIAITFIGEIKSGMTPNHKNGDKQDNRACNLEIVTASQNTLHAFRSLGKIASRGERHYKATLCGDCILLIRKLYAEGRRQRDLMRMFNISRYNVFAIVHRVTWKHIPNFPVN